MAQQAIVIDSRDTVAVAVVELPAGQMCSVRVGPTTHNILLRERVPFGHKFALRPIPAGSGVLKYGEVIGESTVDIEAGAWVHLHNLRSSRGHGRPERESR